MSTMRAATYMMGAERNVHSTREAATYKKLRERREGGGGGECTVVMDHSSGLALMWGGVVGL